MNISLTSLLIRQGALTAAYEAEEGLGVYESRDPNIGEKSLNPNAPMEVDLITDQIIMNSGLKPVTDPIAFNGDTPTNGGLFSPKIFGQTPDEKDRQFAYIDLSDRFFHPYIYEILDDLMPKRFKRCAAGDGMWKLDSDGMLQEIKKGDPDYEQGHTGLAWLVEVFPKMKFKDSNSLVRKDKLKLLKDFPPEHCIITKFLVVPIKYRDIDRNSSTHKLPELNTWYQHIIRYSNSLSDPTFSFFNNQVRFNLQSELVQIRVYAQSLLEKKTGFFHKAILGKSVDYGSRDVISVPSFRGYQKPKDNPVDMFHTGVPLAKCLIIGYEFIMRYCMQFFADNFRNVSEYPIYEFKDGEYRMTGQSIPLADQTARFNSKFIEKKINRFKNSHGTRFEVITLTTKDGKEIPFHMAGQFGALNPKSQHASFILNRPMTWTDLFYQAAVNTLSDKYVYITRYPIEGYNSIFPTLCLPLSTLDTVDAVIEGVHYPRYPIIDLKLDTSKISNRFIDTVTMSNLFLDAIGGDYDGDTISMKLCFSIEANEEAKRISESVKNFIGQDGGLIRVVKNEAFLTYYNMTRNEPVGKVLPEDKKRQLLKLDPTTLTVRDITKLFGYSTSSKKDKKAAFEVKDPEFNLRDKVHLKANEYINTTDIDTTVGKILFNKLMIEGTELIKVVPNGFYNVEVNASKMKGLNKLVAQGVMQGAYSVVPTVPDYLKKFEFWGLCLVTIFSPSYSIETIVPNKKLEERKKELLAQARSGNIADLTQVEDQLVDEASKVLKGTPGMYMFESGARGSFSNDYKNMQLAIGAVENPITKTYDFMTSNYMQGIKKEDIPAAANSVVNAEYPKALGTATGGYMTKQFYAVFQSLMIDEPGSDCGAKYGLPIILTKDNLEDYIDQYIIDGKDLVLITPDLSTKYMNHVVQIRSPMYCCGDKLCNKCAGERYYKIGVNNIGLGSNKLSGSLQNATLKLRHNLKISVDRIDEKAILK